VLRSSEERALRQAATAAVQLTAAELDPSGGERANHLAIVLEQCFRQPMPSSQSEQGTLLESLRAQIAHSLAPLDDPDLTGAGQSAAAVLGVGSTELARSLTTYLIREIIIRGSGGGPFAPLAAQLNQDMTYLQGQRLESTLAQLTSTVQVTLDRVEAQPANTRSARRVFLRHTKRGKGIPEGTVFRCSSRGGSSESG
jgi:hypothetical protein